MTSIVADATEKSFPIVDRGLKATAKIMATLRVEDEVRVAERRMNLARPFKAGIAR